MATFAKISRPRLDRVFARSRLFRRLDEARRRATVVWVEGPPGAGKTTLLASYVERRRLRCLWYRLDADDEDLATFFYYLGRAARSVSRGRRAMPLLTAEYLGAPAVFARRFFRELCRRVSPPFALVFEGCHEVPAASPLHAALREALQELPEGGVALLSSRAEPPPAMATLRAAGALEVLRPDELRLTLPEAIGIARLRGGRSEHAARLHERVGGWAAGLVLLLERGDGGPGAGGVGAAPSVVFDYLAGEIFDRADPAAQRVLLVTALLPRASGRAARALTGITRAPEILADLARRGYFTTLADGPDPSFELHPLFREFLLARGRDALGEAEQRSLRLAAAELLAEDGRVEDAVDLLRGAEAWDELGTLVLAHARAMVEAGRLETLGRWIGVIPAAVRERRPWLTYWLGMARIPFDPAAARGHLEEAYARFAQAANAEGIYLAWAAVAETYVRGGLSFVPLDGWIRRFDEVRRRFPIPSDTEISVRVALASYVAIGFRQPGHPECTEWEERVLAMASAETIPCALRIAAGQFFVGLSAMRGELAGARQVVERLRGVARGPGVGPLEALTWLSAEALQRWASDDFRSSLDVVREALDLAKESGVSLWDFVVLHQGVAAAIASDDLRRAREFLAAMETQAASGIRSMTLEHLRGEVALRVGALDAALDHARAVIASERTVGEPFGVLLGRFVAARAFARKGALAEAEAQLAVIRRDGAAMRCALAEFVASLVGASVSLSRSRVHEAVERVRRGLALGREKEIGSGLWIPPDEMARLCALALEHGVEVEEARRVIRRRRLVPADGASALEEWPWPVRVRLLGRLQIERDGEVVRPHGKVQRRPLQLLALLAASGGRDVHQDDLAAALWPDAEGDAAHHALETTVYRLRRLLGHEEAIVRADGRLTVDERVCWVDALVMERLLVRAGSARETGAAALALTERALAIYRGPLAAPEEDDPPVLAARERLRRQLARHLEGLASRCRAPEERRRVEELRLQAAAIELASSRAGAAGRA